MRDLIKAAGERLLVDSGACRAYRGLACESVILAYHNIVPTDAAAVGDRGIHLDVASFARQLDRLAATHEIVPLRSLLESSELGGRGRAAITFDDAYRGAVRLGVPEVVKRGLSATIFVAPGLLGDRSLWWDQLSRGDEGLDPETRKEMLEAEGGEQHRVLDRAESEGRELREMPRYFRTATEEELMEATESPRVRLEAHGWSHANLVRLSRARAEEECGRAARWVTERTGDRRPLLAYPYGRSTPTVENVARDFFTAAFRVSGGTFRSADLSSAYRVPRINVDANLSLRGFELRTSGLTPGYRPDTGATGRT